MPPPAAPGSSQWIEIADFSAGIHQVVSPHHPLGSAQPDGTARCYSVAGGALAPLPRLSRVIYPPDVPVAPTTLSNTSDDGQYRIIGIHTVDPVFFTDTTPGEDQNNSVIFMGVEYWDHSGPGGGSKVNFVLYRYHRHSLTNPRWETIWSGGDSIEYRNVIRPKEMYFALTRSNNTDHLQGGPSILAFCVSGHAQMHPDDTDTYTNSTRYLPGDTIGDVANTGGLIAPSSLLGHQGRIVIFPLLITGMGANLVTANNEAFYWTERNDARTLDPDITGDYLNQVVGWENPTGYGVHASLTANELFLIKCRGGALIIRGSLDDPDTVTTLPYVRGTGLAMNMGTRSPMGYLYPVDSSGVWLWTGGEISTHITKQMEPDFWRPPAESPAQVPTGGTRVPDAWGDSNTTCADWNEWVLFPNNWLLDTDVGETGAWWKIDDDATHIIHHWSVDWRGRKAHGTPSGYRHGGDPAIYEYSMADKALTYRWRSQPIPGSIDHVQSIDQFGITASGIGKVRLTCRSGDDTVGRSMELTVDDEVSPRVLLSSCGVQGTHITFDLESVGEDDGPAPMVHGIRFLTADTSPIKAF